ncbi:MmgE/PrpD family protein [bacterium]|nr:MmgE/PrpD family protein [bacterium]
MVHSDSVTDRIVAFVTDFDTATIPQEAVHVMRLSLVDWVAVAVAGRGEPVAEILRHLGEEEGGAPEAFVLGSSHRLPARAAARINGATSHALDYDDTHFDSMGHTSVAVIPAVLALADKTEAAPQDVLDAALLGVELAVRIGTWLGRTHYRTGFHVTATAGTFGAAMASARILGLSGAQIRQALGIAASMASGIKVQFGTMGKPFHAGMAASAGVEAALLAANGFVAADDGLEGAQSFAETHHGAMDIAAFDGMGSAFVFTRVSHKFHACCHGIHATLEALANLRAQTQIQPGDIESLQIKVHPQYLGVCNIAEPMTGLEAKFSYRLVAALAMHGHDTAKISTFTDENCHNPGINVLRDKVIVITDEAVPDTAAVVEIRGVDGAVHQASFDLADPIALAEREARVRAKTASLLGEAHAASLWRQVGLCTTTPTDWIASQKFS